MSELRTRRTLLGAAMAGLGALAGAVVSLPILNYILQPLLDPPEDVWRDVGAVDQFQVGETVQVTFEEPSPLPWSGQTATTAAWLRRTGDMDFIAFAVNCAHLGCPVSWLPDAELFLCPCHGGVYYANGDVAGGPPPRGLFQQPVRVRDGRVEIQTRPLQVA